MTVREGSLEAPTRHPIDWKNPEYYDEAKILAEMERVFDICHGCRRCVSLCNAFPNLMLRGKAHQFKAGTMKHPVRDRTLSSTDRNGKLATIPVVVQIVNASA